MIAKIGRFWRTVRHLRPAQFHGRLWFRLHRPRPDLTVAPTPRARRGIWQAPAERAPSLVGPTRFRFLNAEADLAEVGWDHPEQAKLWRYNQHYFDDLTADGWQARAPWHAALITAWIEQNPPGSGTGWEPYPTSLRIINWIKWEMAGRHLPPAAIHSLAVQARWLAGRLEWHLLGNHLFINAKALVFAGLFFEGDEARRWLTKGLAILTREMDEQFLSDGGQFELSPMYHALALEDLLDLANMTTAYPGTPASAIEAEVRTKAAAALRWLTMMSHPDGDIAFFNDAAFGIAPTKEQLFGYTGRLGITFEPEQAEWTHLPASGYVRMTRGPFVLIADLARIGPDYLPGHAHADTLGFELSFGGHRLFVNSGTSEYGNGPERQRQRGTAAHNCLLVAGENSSEVWAGFRVGRRAHPGNIRVGEEEGTLFAEATHDGYRHLPGRPVPHRRFLLTNCALIIEDSLIASLDAEARYHLHPSVAVEDMNDCGATLALPDGNHLRLRVEGGPLRCETATWHSQFGISEVSRCLVLPLKDHTARLALNVNPDET